MLGYFTAQRKVKADSIRPFIGVLARNEAGNIRKAVVPGSRGKQYEVIIRRFNGKGLVTLECLLTAGNMGYTACLGNSTKGERGTICYHSRSALDFAAQEKGFRNFWCSTESAVKCLKKIYPEGKVLMVKSQQNGAQMWVLVVPEKVIKRNGN